MNRTKSLHALAAAVLLVLATPAAPRAEADTEHMFGFSEGSDIGHKGELEGEVETVGRLGRAAGGYSAVTTNMELKYALSDRFRIAGAFAVSRHEIMGVPGLDDRNGVAVDRVSSEMRFRPLDRKQAPVGLTFIATPFFGFIDDDSGAAADRYGVGFRAVVDRALIPDTFFATVNLVYDLDRNRPHANGIASDGSTLGVDLATSLRVLQQLYLGGEARYRRAYDGLALNALAGEALYLGPIVYAPIGGASLSLAWDIQTWGQAVGGPSGLDLANFERHQFKLRLSVEL